MGNDRHLTEVILGDGGNVCYLLPPCARVGDALYGTGQAPDLIMLGIVAVLFFGLIVAPVAWDRLATRKHRYAAFGLGLAVGGFIGNVADVLVDGVIVDYIGMRARHQQHSRPGGGRRPGVLFILYVSA